MAASFDITNYRPILNAGVKDTSKHTIRRSISSAASSSLLYPKSSYLYLALGEIAIQAPHTLFDSLFREMISGGVKEMLTKVPFKPQYRFRPELAAKQAYGSADLWWLVLRLNGILDHQEFKDLESIDVLSEKGVEAMIKLYLSFKMHLQLQRSSMPVIEDLTTRQVDPYLD